VEDDGFIEKHNAYIKAVNEHIYDLIAVMKKDLSGKACQVLAEDVDSDNLKCKNTGNR
jgi:hypothetical protein